MAKTYAKCTKCGEVVLIDNNEEASICSVCGKAFITENAIKLYENNSYNSGVAKREQAPKKRHIGRSFLRGLLMVCECVGYLFYVLFFVWLFVDITDGLKKK